MNVHIPHPHPDELHELLALAVLLMCAVAVMGYSASCTGEIRLPADTSQTSPGPVPETATPGAGDLRIPAPGVVSNSSPR